MFNEDLMRIKSELVKDEKLAHGHPYSVFNSHTALYMYTAYGTLSVKYQGR